MNIRLSAAFVAALLLLSVGSYAEDATNTNEITALAGVYTVPTNITLVGQDKIARNGAGFGFRYLRNVDPKLAVGGEFSHLSAGSHDSTVLVPNAITRTSLTSNVFLGEVRARWGDGALRPFLLGGFGVHATSMEIDVNPQAGFVWTDTGTSEVRTAVDTTKSSLAATLQGGVEYHFSPSVCAGAFAAWYYLGSASYESTNAGRNGGLASVSGNFSGLSLGGLLTAKF
jgi:hypothetical protein